MITIKSIIPVLIATVIFFGCSKTRDFLKSIGQSAENSSGEENDFDRVNFYNKYIDVMNSLSSHVDNFQKAYYDNIPDPMSLSRNTFISFAGSQVSLTFLETEIKKHKRSFFEGGELSKLELKDANMKKDIEDSFKDYISTAEKYYSNALRIFEYYKDNNFKDDLSKAKVLDADLKTVYAEYTVKYESFKSVLKKYKPVRKLKNPDDFPGNDEKAAVILQNTIDITMDNAEKFYEKFSTINMTSDITELKSEHETFKKTFDNDKLKVLSAPFTEKSFYLKNNFEDYFSKMVYSYSNAVDELFKKMEKGNLNSREFGYAFDNAKNYYNYMVQSYNTTITLLNSFRVY